jgi:UPF0042 nucleotide-binding protein
MYLLIMRLWSFLEPLISYIDNILSKDGIYKDRETLTIVFGCFGGKHRSVAIAEEVGRRLRLRGYEVGIKHRDINK